MNAPRAFTATGRRSLPRVLGGVGLVVVCALIFAVIATRTEPQVKVLALNRDVAAGQALSADDLTVVDVTASGAAAAGLVPAGQEPDWIGRTLASPLPAGQLLNPANLGPAAWPPAGQAVVAVPLQAGHLPAGVVPGSPISVVLSTQSPLSAAAAGSAGGSAAGTSQARALAASVVQITGLPASGIAPGPGARTASTPISGDGAVLSLLMSSGDAAVVAATAAGDVSVILQGRGTGG